MFDKFLWRISACSHFWKIHICLGVSWFGNVKACTLSSKMRERTPHLFLPGPLPPLNLKTVQTPPPLLVRVRPPPWKNKIFQWTPIIKLKVTKFLIKFSQFKFLVNTDKDIYKLFLSLYISDFNLFFMQKLHPQQKEGVHYVRSMRITC